MLSRALLILLFLGLGQPVLAQDLRALARVDLANSELVDVKDGVRLILGLSQGVPFKLQTFNDPMRLAIDFREVAFDRSILEIDRSERIVAVQAGVAQAGWSRLILEMDRPMGVFKAWMDTDSFPGSAVLHVRLEPVSDEVFSAGAVDAGAPVLDTQDAVSGKRVIALDPGHGGVDPGAQRDGQNEADLMLLFARELRETLLRSGRYEVVLTRNEDTFVSLPRRVSIARKAGAMAFLSLHADAIAKGRASGLTVYTLSQEATDAASADLAERQNRSDIVGGVDLQGDDDQIATVLMDLARQDTTPKANSLADQLVETMREELGHLHKRPRLEAGFSVLKAPDIPSVLIELGFMSSENDLAALNDPEWRTKAATGILHALDAWGAQALVEAEK